MKTVNDIMIENPKVCGKNDPLKSVVTIMSNANIGTLPVVDKENKVIGIITDRDVCLTIGRTNKHLNDLKVYEAMTHRAHTCKPEDKTATALKIMRTQKVGRLPVVDKEGKLKGIISLNSIVRQMHETNDKAEIEYAGKENVLNTLHSIAERNHDHHYDYEHWEE